MMRKPVSDWSEKTATVCLNDWAQEYLDVARVRFTTATYMEKRSMFKRVFKEIDPNLPVSTLKPGDVLTYIIKQKEARSGYAANKDRKNLVAAWNWGMKYMNPPLPGPNPCLVDRMPEVREPRYVPPEEDFWKVYDQTEGQDKVMLLTLLHLAARKGEIFRLTWSDVDFGNNSVRLTTRKRADGSLENNWVPMTKELRKALLWWWENRPVKGATNVFLCLDDTEFCREYYGKPFLKRLQFMRRLCDRAGVKRFGFHGIRHLTATTLYKLGYEVATIQTILRHKSPSTTERYLKNLGLEERARSALEELSSRRGQVLEFKPYIQKIAVPSLQK
jgi:integrase